MEDKKLTEIITVKLNCTRNRLGVKEKKDKVMFNALVNEELGKLLQSTDFKGEKKKLVKIY
jgi:hypothetical protein